MAGVLLGSEDILSTFLRTLSEGCVSDVPKVVGPLSSDLIICTMFGKSSFDSSLPPASSSSSVQSFVQVLIRKGVIDVHGWRERMLQRDMSSVTGGVGVGVGGGC